MTTAQINLTDSQTELLRELSRRTGKTEDDLLQEAVEKLIGEESAKEVEKQKWLKSLKQAKGIWKDREDLPDFTQIRKEFDRFSQWNEE